MDERLTVDDIVLETQKRILLYEFKVLENYAVLPVDLNQTYENLESGFYFEILAPKDFSMRAVASLSDYFQALYPRHLYDWDVTTSETIQSNYLVVCLVEK